MTVIIDSFEGVKRIRKKFKSGSKTDDWLGCNKVSNEVMTHVLYAKYDHKLPTKYRTANSSTTWFGIIHANDI